MEAFKIENLNFTYPEQSEKAVDNVSLTVQNGEFLVVCGYSGGGKSTLLKHLKPTLAPCGERTGKIEFFGRSVFELERRAEACEIGFVTQSAEEQLVTDKVWHELAFGLESLGVDSRTIRRRCEETAAFFGMENLYHKSVSELSGGQKQMLCVAAVMVMRPKVLILDEPTAQLDPVAAGGLLSMLGKINRELGVTVILSEHRLEDVCTYATRVAVMENGRILCCNSVAETGVWLKKHGSGMFAAMPCATRVWGAVESSLECPVTVNEGRRFLSEYVKNNPVFPLDENDENKLSGEERVRTANIWYRYEKQSPDVIRGLDFSARAGETVCILGSNGGGKTTLLKILCGLKKPYRGHINISGRIGYLPQEPQTLFVKKTLYDEFCDIVKRNKKSENDITEVADLCGVSDLLYRHPLDLSGGELTRAALALVLLTTPEILLLDEPTKGLDAPFKAVFADILKRLKSSGVCVVMVSHDIDFCAQYADRCCMFFDGRIDGLCPPREFFSENNFYTTAANRIAGEIEPHAVTTGDIIEILGGKPQTAKITFQKKEKTNPTPKTNHTQTTNTKKQIPTAKSKQNQEQKSIVLAAVCALLLVPLTVCAGTVWLEQKQYYITALAVLVECMFPFFFAFERKKHTARELVTAAVLCALAIAGRAVFFMLPQVKPVTAIVIVAGIAFGGEMGFLVGAVTMLVSNMLFSQGPWTPWQMLAMGLIGFVSGLIFRNGLPKKPRIVLSVFGAVCALVIYGGIVNPVGVLVWGGETLSLKTLLACYAAGLPMDLIHAVSTAVFLWFGAEPLLEKLYRVKSKYGI